MKYLFESPTEDQNAEAVFYLCVFKAATVIGTRLIKITKRYVRFHISFYYHHCCMSQQQHREHSYYYTHMLTVIF